MLNILDKNIINLMNSIENPLLDKVMIFFTLIGDTGIIWITVILILCLRKKTRNIGIVMVISLTFVMILNNYLKLSVNRVRPFDYLHFVPKIKHSGSASFPSAHTSAAFTMLGIFNFYNLEYKRLIGYLAIFIGFSRVYFKVHYFTDVLAGALLGLLVAYIVIYFYSYIFRIIRENNNFNNLKFINKKVIKFNRKKEIL